MKIRLHIFVSLFYFFAMGVNAEPNLAKDPRISKVYEHFQNQPIWIKNGEWSPCAKILFDTIRRVDQEGLWASDYDPLVHSLEQFDIRDAQQQMQADQLLTLVALNYISDMKGERIKPRAAHRNLRIKQVVVDEVKLLKDFMGSADQCAWVSVLAPKTHEYQHLREALALYRQKQAQGGWPMLPKGTKLEMGDMGPHVYTLKQQLIAQDALSEVELSRDDFDDRVDAAVRRYQELHGLTVDGVVGPETLAALNTTVEERIQSIIVSMEVLRWLPLPLPHRYLVVNVPGYYLKAVSRGDQPIFIPIITGKSYQKTPIFNTTLTLVTFNPSWYIPRSIQAEIVPKMNRNPGAYAQKGYYWRGGRLIQGPGNANSLGKIKFYLENSYGVYLHGTPAMGLFKKAKRALSHGCMRVEDPYKLAEFVLDNPQKWPLERVRQSASGTRTKKVKVAPPLATFITYLTVFEDENEDLHFVRDVYGIEKEIWEDLVAFRRS